MIHIQTQNFYDKNSSKKHEVTLMFGHINPCCRGRYDIIVDNKFYSTHNNKTGAFDKIVDIIQMNNWAPLSYK